MAPSTGLPIRISLVSFPLGSVVLSILFIVERFLLIFNGGPQRLSCPSLKVLRVTGLGTRIAGKFQFSCILNRFDGSKYLGVHLILFFCIAVIAYVHYSILC